MSHFRDDSFHQPVQESPVHSRVQSYASDWNGRYDEDGNRLSNSDQYSSPQFANSTSQLPGLNQRMSDATPTTNNNSGDAKLPLTSPSQSNFSPPSLSHPVFAASPLAASKPIYPDSSFPGDDRRGSDHSLKTVNNLHIHKAQEILGPTKEASRPALPPPGGGPPPDGGTTAWLQVFGGYFLFFNTWGLINAFGVFQTYYVDDLLKDTPNSTIAWIGTLTSFFLCASPISWGPLFDIGNPRILVLFGSASVVLGIMMTSLSTQYYQLILSQGICCGIGGGALFITATSVLPSYFAKKRALAMGISASGSSLGGIVYPLIFNYVQPTLGFPWAVRIIGFIALVTLAIPCLVIKPRPKPPGQSGPRKIFNAAILRELSFGLMNVATFFGFVGQYIPYFFIEQFASAPQHRGLTSIVSPFWMLIFLNVGSIPGRILPSLVADKYFHPLKVLATTTLCATILAFAWIAIIHSAVGLIIWCLLYGFFSGAFVSLQGAAVASMTADLRTIGTRFGLNMFAGALGILIGSPVGGAIFPSSWVGAQVFCGVTLGFATAAIVGTWVAWRWEVRKKEEGERRGGGGSGGSGKRL